MKNSIVLFLLLSSAFVLGSANPSQSQFSGTNSQILNDAARNFHVDNWQQAVEQFRSVLDTSGYKTLGENDFILANMYLFFSYFKLKLPNQQTDVAKRILRVDKDVSVDPSDFSEDYSTIFDNEKARVLDTLNIITEPPDALVFLDDNLIGVTPLDTVLVEDRYNLRVESPGYKIKVEGISVIANQPNEFRYTLRRHRKTWRWYALGASALVGGGVFILTNGENRPDLPSPPDLTNLDNQ